jgi:hypothetical protein
MPERCLKNQATGSQVCHRPAVLIIRHSPAALKQWIMPLRSKSLLGFSVALARTYTIEPAKGEWAERRSVLVER